MHKYFHTHKLGGKTLIKIKAVFRSGILNFMNLAETAPYRKTGDLCSYANRNFHCCRKGVDRHRTKATSFCPRQTGSDSAVVIKKTKFLNRRNADLFV